MFPCNLHFRDHYKEDNGCIEACHFHGGWCWCLHEQNVLDSEYEHYHQPYIYICISNGNAKKCRCENSTSSDETTIEWDG